MSRRMRIGVVGCGGISHSHAKAIAKSQLLELVACADIDAKRASDWAQQYHLTRSYESMRRMIESEQLDTVILATWPAQHVEQIRTACELKTPAILCEKSLALSGDEGDEIARIVRGSGSLLMEGVMYRHHPQVMRAKELIAEGVIGDVQYVRGQFTFGVDLSDRRNWRARKDLGGGSMMDQGCYMVNALNYFAQALPVEAFAKSTYDEALDLDTGHSATVTYENGVIGQLHCDQRSDWREEIQITGTTGSILIPSALVTTGQTRWIEIQRDRLFDGRSVERIEFQGFDSYMLQLENIRACLFEGKAPRVTLDESVQNLHVISAIVESGRGGRAVEVV